MTELLRLVRKAKQLGLFEGFDIPESLRRAQRKPRAKRRKPVIETPEQIQLSFKPSPRTLAEVRAIIKRLQEGELPAAKKDGVTLALRAALAAHPTGAVAAINAMRRALVKLGLPEDKAKRIAVTEVRGAVNALLYDYASRYAREHGVTLLKRWRHNDKLVKEPRCNHQKLHGTTVAIDEPFTLTGADGVVYKPRYPHDGLLPASEVINCQCAYDLVRGRKQGRETVLKALLHALAVWKRRTYKLGDERENPRTGRKERKLYTGRGADNWVPVERAQDNPDMQTELNFEQETGTAAEYFTPTEERTPALPAAEIAALVDGDKSEAEILTAEEALLSAGKAKAVEAAAALPKTVETLQAVRSAVEYFRSNSDREIYGNDYGQAGFPDNFTAERRAEIAAVVAAYKAEHPNAVIAWDRREYLVDYKKKGQPPLKDANGKNIARNMSSEEERVLDYIMAHPDDTRRVFHRIPAIVKQKLFNRFGYGEVPGVKQRDTLAEIAGKLKSGEYTRAGSDMAAVADEEITTYPTPEASDADNRRRLERLRKRWRAARGIAGDAWKVNGQAGHWRLVEAAAPTASHDEHTFEQSRDFIHSQDGRTMNDRDYRVETNQENVREYGKAYDGRALSLDEPVVVSPDGVVLSGNNRTMSSKLAAESGTDKRYLERLHTMADKFGFTAEQVEQFKHPRVVFELDEMREPYSTKLFAEYNTDDEKQMDAKAAAEKASRLLDEDAARAIASALGRYHKIEQAYDDPEAVGQIMDGLIGAGLINLADKGRYVSGGGVVTTEGKTFIENTMLASVLSPDSMSKLNHAGMDKVKGAILRAVPRLLKDAGARRALQGGIEIFRDALVAVRNVDALDDAELENAASGGMFGEAKAPEELAMAKLLIGKQNDLNKSLGGNIVNETKEDAKRRRAATETAEVNAGRVKAIREKFANTRRFMGKGHSIMLGEQEVAGNWELLDATAPTASHDEYTFGDSNGFPQDDFGKNVNDRNYQKEKDAQQKVIEYGQNYNAKALGFDKPVVVSSDGVVLSGNNRTMSSKRAAKEGTDAAYLEALKKQADKFGFTAEQVEQFKHPRVVFRPKEEFPYTTEVFARFNGKDKKGQNEEEAAVKVAKVIDEKARRAIARQVYNAGGLAELFQDKTRLQMVLNELANKSAISNTEMNTLVDTDGKVSAKGEMFVKGAFAGMSLGENAVHQLYWGGMQNIREQVYNLTGELMKNNALPQEYSIKREFDEAVSIAADLARKRKSYPNAAAYKEQNPNANKLSLYIAEKLFDGEFNEGRMRTLINALKNESENDGFIVEQEPKETVIERFIRKARRRAAARRILKAWTRLWRIYEEKAREAVIKRLSHTVTVWRGQRSPKTRLARAT